MNHPLVIKADRLAALRCQDCGQLLSKVTRCNVVRRNCWNCYRYRQRHGMTLAPKAWSTFFDACETCGNTSYKHHALGVCNSCAWTDQRHERAARLSEKRLG